MLVVVLVGVVLVAVITFVSGLKGLRALMSLGLSYIFLIKGIVPAILHGYDPVLVMLAGGLPIVALIIYSTEGFNYRAHLSLASIIAVSAVVLPLGWLCVRAAHLTGFTSEEEGYVAGYGTHTIDMVRLLFAGIIMGIFGAISESIVAQIAVVEQLFVSRGARSVRDLYQQATTVGAAHLNAVINTLFLIYASVSLPLLIIFIGGNDNLTAVFQSEVVLTDIIRIMVGAIGIAVSLPIATGVGLYYFSRKNGIAIFPTPQSE